MVIERTLQLALVNRGKKKKNEEVNNISQTSVEIYV